MTNKPKRAHLMVGGPVDGQVEEFEGFRDGTCSPHVILLTHFPKKGQAWPDVERSQFHYRHRDGECVYDHTDE